MGGGDDRYDLALLGDQERLKLTRSHGRIDGKLILIRNRAVEFGRDSIQPTDAFPHGRMRAG
ncbi:Uncharacterised protein [Mycobacterium tuberculosis]|nr:Uncharacterised protein [Mycobacterium tuberculosis]